MTTIFRFYNPETTNHLFTTDKNEVAHLRLDDDWNYEGPKWQTNGGDIEVYRFFNNKDGRHLLTSDEDEKDNIINNLPDWNYEGVAFNTDATSGVYRYQHENGSFFYTSDDDERNFIDANLPHLTPNNSSFAGYPIDPLFEGTESIDVVDIEQLGKDIMTHEGNDTINVFYDGLTNISVDAGNGDDAISTSTFRQLRPEQETTLYGGNGADTFIINGAQAGLGVSVGGGWGNTIIEDFDPTENDELVIYQENTTTPLNWKDERISISEVSDENGDYTQIDLSVAPFGIAGGYSGTISLLGVSNDIFNDYIGG